MDSQAKYAAVARGDAALYLRLPSPKSPDYREKIWDHAAGAIVVEEAGGRVTDLSGRSLDFGHGQRLEENRGVVDAVLSDTALGASVRLDAERNTLPSSEHDGGYWARLLSVRSDSR